MLVFVTALLMALAAILIRAMFGKRVAWFIGVIGALSVLLPLVIIIILGIMGMLKAGSVNDKAPVDLPRHYQNYPAQKPPRQRS